MRSVRIGRRTFDRMVIKVKPIKCVVRYRGDWAYKRTDAQLLMRFDCVIGFVPVPFGPYSDRPSDLRMIFRDDSLGWYVYWELRNKLATDQISKRYDPKSDKFTIVLYGATLSEGTLFEELGRIPEVKLVW